jgi:hypothetical protein
MAAAKPAELRLSRHAVVLTLASLANLAPVIWFGFLPTRDGPAHAFNADLIRSLWAGHVDAVAGLVRWNPSPVPNWLGHGFMALAGVVVGPFLAERFLLVVIVLSWPLALRYAIRAVTSVETGVEYLALPLVWGTHLHWGFYNFLLGVSAYLFSAGYWFRHRDHFGGRTLACWSALLVVTYLASAQPFLHALAFAVLVTLFVEGPSRTRALGNIALAAAPAVCLFALFVLFRPHVAEPGAAFPSARWAAASLFRLDILRGVEGPDRLLTPIAALAFWGLVATVCLTRWREPRPTLVWMLALGIAADVAMLFAAPTSGGGGTLLTPRQAVMTVLLIALCLAADPDRLPAARTIAAASVVLALALHVSRWPFYAAYDTAMRDFVHASRAIEPGQLLYAAPLDCDQPGPDGSSRPPCLSGHAGAYVALTSHAVLVNDYELQTAHFPLVAAHPASDGQRAWAGGRPIDVVLLWRGSVETRRKIAARLLADRSGCEVESRSLVPSTLFFVDCGERP